MKLLIYIILGIIQGITEPIPVSSSGHLLIIKRLFNIKFNDLNFEIFVNFGSFIAITLFYRKEIIDIIKDFILYIKAKNKTYYKNYKYALMIIISTIPAGIIGLLLKDKIENFINIKIIGLSLIITSIMLFLVRNTNGKKEDINTIDALIIGLFQVIALFPGISRSGSTLVGGLSRNLTKETAFKYSFMLYLPISIATMILGVKDIITSNINHKLLILYIISTLISLIVTYITIDWFKNILLKDKLKYFIYYCFIIGLLVILFL